MIIDSKTGEKYVGFYKGQVLAHLENGNCKIWIPGVYPEEWKATSTTMKDVYENNLRGAKLPTATPSFPPVGGKGFQGIYAVPAIDSIVWCFFENEDPNFPVYFASIAGNDSIQPLAEMTKQTIDKPSFQQAKLGNAPIERDVIIRFGRAYVMFSPNQSIEIGFKASEKKTGEVSENSEALENPKIIIDNNGLVKIISQGGIELIGQKNAGIRLVAGKNELKLNKTGLQITSNENEGGVIIYGRKTVSMYSDFNVDVQKGKATYPGPGKYMEEEESDQE